MGIYSTWAYTLHATILYNDSLIYYFLNYPVIGRAFKDRSGVCEQASGDLQGTAYTRQNSIAKVLYSINIHYVLYKIYINVYCRGGLVCIYAYTHVLCIHYLYI